MSSKKSVSLSTQGKVSGIGGLKDSYDVPERSAGDITNPASSRCASDMEKLGSKNWRVLDFEDLARMHAWSGFRSKFFDDRRTGNKRTRADIIALTKEASAAYRAAVGTGNMATRKPRQKRAMSAIRSKYAVATPGIVPAPGTPGIIVNLSKPGEFPRQLRGRGKGKLRREYVVAWVEAWAADMKKKDEKSPMAKGRKVARGIWRSAIVATKVRRTRKLSKMAEAVKKYSSRESVSAIKDRRGRMAEIKRLAEDAGVSFGRGRRSSSGP